jgi:hypothetical protein
MIVWDSQKQRFEWGDRYDFPDVTRVQVQQFQQSISQPYPFNLPSNATPLDKVVSTATITSRKVPSGTNLCHHVSIGVIQEVMCAYLNGEISFWVFMNFVGNVATPTWLTLMDSNSRAIVLKQWADSLVTKLSIAVNSRFRQKSKDQIAKIADDFCNKLNKLHVNLRYGDETTNKSISDHLDARLATGFTFDPFTWIEHVWGYCIGGPVFASETSAFINAEYDEALASKRVSTKIAVRAPGTVAMSESDVTVATTSKSGKPVKGANAPYASVLRGNIPGLLWSPVDRSTAVSTVVLAYGFVDRSTLILAFGVCYVVAFLFQRISSRWI